jgi:transposase
MNNSVISVDLAKNVFQVCVLNEHKVPVYNKKIRRTNLLKTIAKLEPQRIVMESCYSANYWGREFQKLGREVKLIPPHQVKPFVIGNKNDANDALAIAEASFRPKTTFVPVKTIDQQDLQSLHRIRDRLVRSRTSLTNQMRGLLSEYGIVIAKNISALRKNTPFILEDADNKLSTAARTLINEMYQELIQIDKRIKSQNNALEAILVNHDDYRRLKEVPGIGPVVGSALIASVGDAMQFENGRKMSSWLGLTPKQFASGDNTRMGGISKRGNRTLRKLMIDGARSLVTWVGDKADGLSCWIRKLLSRVHYAKVLVAVANKLTRMCWAVLAKKEQYRAPIASI